MTEKLIQILPLILYVLGSLCFLAGSILSIIRAVAEVCK